jgi:2-oxoisovalerate dehydrogenase E2 component (dihydrolipoyl transacylase)
VSDAEIREFLLPDLGEGLEEGEIVAWHVEVGDPVELNQPIADVETAKAVVAVPSPFTGVVEARVGEVGETLAVGSVLVRIRVSGNGAAAAADPAEAAASVAGSNGAVEEADPAPLVGYGQSRDTARRRRASGGDGASAQAPAPVGAGAPRTRGLAKPPVRKLARDLGVDLAEIAATGPGGTVTRDDVRAAASASAPAAPPAGFRGHRPGDVAPIRAIRKRIVDKMELAHREIPVAAATRDVDLTRLWELRHDLTAQAVAAGLEVKITPFTVLLRATVLGLQRYPSLNARIIGRDTDAGEAGSIELHRHVNLGVAVDTDHGLVVPTVKRAEERSLVELAVELTELAARAREGTLDPAALTGGTFTVNNYGVFGVDDALPIINHPEAGILGIGTIRERPWVVDGAVVPRRVATLRLAFDHRVSDGGEAGRFVAYVAELCEEPTRFLLHA